MTEKYSNTGTTTTTGKDPTRLRITKKADENATKTVSNRTSEKTGISKTDVKDQRLQITHAVEDKLSKNQQDVEQARSIKRNLLSKTLSETDQHRGGFTQSFQGRDGIELVSLLSDIAIIGLDTNQRPMMILEGIGINSQTTSLLQHNIKNLLQALSETDQHRGGFTQSFQGKYGIELVSLSFAIAIIGLDTNQHAMMIPECIMINSQTTSLLQHNIKNLLQDRKLADDVDSISPHIFTIDSLQFYSQGGADASELASLKFHSLGGTDAFDSISPHISTNDSLQFYSQGEADASYNKLEYIERITSFIYSSNLIVDVGFEKRLCKNMNLAKERFEEVLGKGFHAQIDEFGKNLFSIILKVGNDEKANQHFGKKEKMELKKLIKEGKRLLNQTLKLEIYFQKENPLTEPEKTEQWLKEQFILEERERDLQKENELKEQVKAELPADNILFHRTKVRNAKSKMNTSSLYRAYNLYRKNVLEIVLVSLEQLAEALDSVKSPHYIWPSGHPLILSKVRQIEQYFSSNEHMERLHSFVNGRNRRHRTWDSEQIVRPEPMVSAGFSYDGEDDKVVCKSCGAISDVNDWSDDDEDYAFTMHRRTASSHCEFLRKFDQRRSKM